MNDISTAPTSASRRAAAMLFALCALGEIAVGAALIAYPSIAALLLAASLDDSARLLARMLGAAALALGTTWWLARGEPGLARHAAGFLVYNAGVGILFGLAALAAMHPLVPWIVSIVHLVAATVFGMALAIGARTPDRVAT